MKLLQTEAAAADQPVIPPDLKDRSLKRPRYLEIEGRRTAAGQQKERRERKKPFHPLSLRARRDCPK
ncbi:hypothetical protein [Brevundimonas sp. M20]|uniref:hypothetical protein n=1 Tax=Brevundimonas sp. M20 TaxID=2591463 RepID=UPI00143CEF3B|nr:hypothetical protein [Brevundimonas sp. M20]